MKTTKPTWNMKKLQRMLKSGSISFDYPIQRASGQWDALQQSLLIHSVVADMPIPPIAVAKATVDNNESEYVIDGKQRTTTVLNYMSGVKDSEGRYPDTAYKLHSDTPDVFLEGHSEPLPLANLYFDELHADLRSDLESASFMIQRMEDATDEQIEEIFNRWNNGTPLTKQQKSRGKMGTKNATIISHLMSHPFIQKTSQFTPLQRKRSDDEAVLLQAMLLLNPDKLNSFVADKILEFASEFRTEDITPYADSLTQAMDYLSVATSPSPLFKKLHLPMVLIIAKEASDNNVDKRYFEAWVEDFNTVINLRTKDKALVKPSNYRNFTGAGSVKRDKVLGRLDEMRKHFNEFLAKYELPEATEEEKQKIAERELELELNAIQNNDSTDEVVKDEAKATKESKSKTKNEKVVASEEKAKQETSVAVITPTEEEQAEKASNTDESVQSEEVSQSEVNQEEVSNETESDKENQSEAQNALDIIAEAEKEQSVNAVSTPSTEEA